MFITYRFVIFCFSRSPLFTNKATIFLETGYTWKYRLIVKDFLANENESMSISCSNVFVLATGKKIAGKTGSETCTMLVVWTLSDLALKRPSSFINNFEQVNYEIFFSLKSYSTFLHQWLMTLITRVTSWKCNRSNMVFRSSCSENKIN